MTETGKIQKRESPHAKMEKLEKPLSGSKPDTFYDAGNMPLTRFGCAATSSLFLVGPSANEKPLQKEKPSR